MTGGLSAQGVHERPAIAGIGIACVAMACYALMESASKLLTAGYHPTQILVFRAALACVFALVAARRRGGSGVVRSARPKLQLLRGAIGCGSMMAAIFAYSVLPLADVLAVVYSAPILVTLLSVPVLGEAVGVRRLAAAGIGFVGVLLIVQPGRAVSDPVVFLPVLSMVCYAVSATLTRKLGRHDNGLTTLFYTQIVYLGVCLPVQPLVWVTPQGEDIVLFAVVACAGAAAQSLLISAYSSSPPAAIAPFDYTTLLWATLLGYLIWGDFPDPVALAGMSIVIASGIYIALRELHKSPPRRRGPVYLAIRQRDR